jgi:transcriptional regulator with XRE-family HTH domain
MSVGERLKHLRNNKNLSQQELSDRIGVNRSTYARYETNDTQADYDTLQRLANFYDVSVDYILGRGTSFATPKIINDLTEEEIKILIEMRKHPKFAVMFHDLAKNPEKKLKTLIKMWEVIKEDIDEDNENPEDLIKD